MWQGTLLIFMAFFLFRCELSWAPQPEMFITKALKLPNIFLALQFQKEKLIFNNFIAQDFALAHREMLLTIIHIDRLA